MRVLGFLALSAISFASIGCTGGQDPWIERPGPRVLAYFPPIYSFAATIAGDDAQVRSLITHIGPHHFDPSDADAMALRRTDLFLTNGLGLDDEVVRKLSSTAGNSKMKVASLGTLIPKDQLHEGGCACCEGHHHHHKPGEVEYDPHVWLGIPEAQRMIEGVRDELVAADPANAESYRKRAAEMHDRLEKLHTDGKAMLAAKKEPPKVITFHPSLFYFARSFGIEVVDSIQVSGEGPSAKKLKELVESCKKNQVRIIATEPQYASRTDAARTIMNELKRAGIDAVLVELDPLETAGAMDLTPDFYERKMRQNVTNLAKVLK